MVREEVCGVLEKDFPELKLDLLTSIDISTEKLLDTLMGYSREVGIIYNSWFVGKKQSESHYLSDNLQKLYMVLSMPRVHVNGDGYGDRSFAGGYFISASTFGKVAVQTIRQILDGCQPECRRKDRGRAESLFELSSFTTSWCRS